MILRGFTIAGGLGLILASAHVLIAYTGGYGTPHAVLTMAIAGGVGLGSLVIGRAWSEKRRALALGIGVALVAGELFGLIGTSERLIAQREAAQAPLRAQADARAIAAQRVTAAEAALSTIPASSPRLAAATTAKDAADKAASDKATERGCRENCRQLLQDQVNAAAAEVAAARGELVARRTAAETELSQARTILGGSPVPASGTPLADRLGVAPWILDLAAAALGSIAANGLGGLLLAFGAHRPARAPVARSAVAEVAHISPDPIPVMRDVTPTPEVELLAPPIAPPVPAVIVPDVIQHLDAFAVAAITAKPRARASLGDVHAAYLAWCATEGIAPVSDADFADAMSALVKAAGIKVTMANRAPVLLGVRVNPALLSPANDRAASKPTVAA